MGNNLTAKKKATPNKTKLLKRAAAIHREFLREVEELEEENRKLARGGWARSNYCKHGTFIGDPYGADYMCGYCEDSVSDLEYALGKAYSAFRRDRTRFDNALVFLSIYASRFISGQEEIERLSLEPTAILPNVGDMFMEILTIRDFEKEWL